MATILVVEDEFAVARGLQYALQQEGYEVTVAPNGEEGLAIAGELAPDLIVLDVRLPGIDGFELLRRLRATGSKAPVLMLTARDDEVDKVIGLELGADDYLTKPFGSRELLARVRVALRHASRASSPEVASVFRAGSLTVDLAHRKVLVADELVHLTPLEYKLLTTLIEHFGKVLTHRQLLERVWGPAHVGQTQYLRVYMAQLRRKIERNPARPELLKTETGVGYRLDSPESS
jgi:two-component system, OmpR family, KDP operon response regulator KdpE